MKKRDKYYIIPIILLTIYFLIRLLNQSQMLDYFPTDAYANDFSGHIAKLHLLDKHGLHANVPEWYSGNYTMLKFYPPGWYLASLPLVWIFKDPVLASFISMILMYILGFIFIYKLSLKNRISKTKAIAFFLFFFANPISIGYFLRLGKMPEMFAWVLFIPFFSLLVYYLKKPLDLKFLFAFTVLYSAIFYAHTLVFVPTSLLALSFFVAKKSLRNKLFIITAGLFSLLITSFFWYPFLTQITNTTYSNFAPLTWLILPGNTIDKISSFIIPVLFLITSYFYIKENKKELSFYIIPMIFSFLILTRIAVFIPFFNRASPDTFHLFYLFLSIFMILKLKNLPLKKFFPYLLTGLILIGILLSISITPFFRPHTEVIQETFTLFEYAESPVLVIKGDSEVHPAAVLSYATIYHNISTPIGWEPINVTEKYWQKTLMPEHLLEENDVKNMQGALKIANTKSIIAYDNNCIKLKKSDLEEVLTLKRSCLYKLP